MLAGVFVIPSWRHHPGVLAGEIAALRFRNRGLIPWMPYIDGISEWIPFNKLPAVPLPIVVKGMAKQNANTEIDIDEAVGNDFSINDDTRSDEHGSSPTVHVFVPVVTLVRIVEGTPAPEQCSPIAHLFISRQRLIHEI